MTYNKNNGGANWTMFGQNVRNNDINKKYGNQKQYTGKKSNLLASSNVMQIDVPEGKTLGIRCVSGAVDAIQIRLALDSGATCSIISANAAKQHGFVI